MRALILSLVFCFAAFAQFNPPVPPGGGGSMTWPATPGIPYCTGTPCTAWGGTSLTSASGLKGITFTGSAPALTSLGTAAVQNTGTNGANLPFLNGTNTWANNQTFQGSVIRSGNLIVGPWTTSGIRFKTVASTFTDAVSTGTVATGYTDLFGADTIAAGSGALTFTNYFGSFFKAPVAGTNVTFTNSYALGADSAKVGSTIIDGTVSGTLGPAAVSTSASTTVNGQTCTLGSTCTVTGAPSGSAGGALAGTYPNPTIATLGQDLLFSDATYDIGKSGATRPRDLFLSRNETVAGSLILSGNISAAAWTTNGLRIQAVPSTFTDTTSSGTVAAAYTDVFGGNTIAASSATTFTNYYTTYIKAPVAGSNVTMTNKFALGVDSLYSAGNVGIGTTSPGAKLEVNASAQGNAVISALSTAVQFPTVLFYGNNGYYTFGIGHSSNVYTNNWYTSTSQTYFTASLPLNIETSVGYNLTLGTNNTANVTIQNGGNVGIGTTSPVYLLDVAKSGASGTARFKDQTATTGATRVLVDLGAADSASTTIFTLAGVQRFNGTNTTGAGTALLGTNSPAGTLSAPYTWIQVVTSDGSTAYVPVWK